MNTLLKKKKKIFLTYFRRPRRMEAPVAFAYTAYAQSRACIHTYCIYTCIHIHISMNTHTYIYMHAHTNIHVPPYTLSIYAGITRWWLWVMYLCIYCICCEPGLLVNKDQISLDEWQTLHRISRTTVVCPIESTSSSHLIFFDSDWRVQMSGCNLGRVGLQADI